MPDSNDGDIWISPSVGEGSANPHKLADELFQIDSSPYQFNKKRLNRIRVVRGSDLLDCTIEFENYYYHSKSFKFGPIGSGGQSLKLVVAAQHISEEITRIEENNPADTKWGQRSLRSANPSRIAMRARNGRSHTGYISVADLFNWKNLETIVSPRALGPNAGLQEQLSAGFPVPNPSDLQNHLENLGIQDAIEIFDKQFQAPAENETALEIIGKLILSPGKGHNWTSSPKTVLPTSVETSDGPYKNVPLWTIRPDETGRKSIRALYSEYFPGVDGLPQRTDVNEGTPDPNFLALTKRNHWEIVAQTSIYGLPALMKRGVEANGASDAKNPVNLDAGQIPRISVQLPDNPAFEIKYVTDLNRYFTTRPGQSGEFLDTGIALANPFEEANIRLTSLGATFHADWKGDPAQLLLRDITENDDGWQPGDREWSGFDLERLTYDAFLGRDSKVVSVEKGYLFPLGIRASLITVAERQIHPLPIGGGATQPASFEVQYQFITTPGKWRQYPGPYMPFEGRNFPPSRVRMITRVTPKLVTPEAFLKLDGVGPDEIFLPQVVINGSPEDYFFSWETDDAAINSRLIFVRNSVVGKESVMRQLVTAYRKLSEGEKTPQLSSARSIETCQAKLFGSRQRYAPARRPGDTSFDTHEWILSAEGRRPTSEGSDFPDQKYEPFNNGESASVGEHFLLDGLMEGANQPPFYPVLKRARVSAQSIDQLMGRPQGQIWVEPYHPYVKDGFTNKPEGAAEIYLQVSGGNLSVPTSSSSDRSGGVASPDMQVYAFSRSMGPIGGTPTNSISAESGQLSNAAFDKAAQGEFDASQFMPKAKLLGVVELSEILKFGKNHKISIDDDEIPKLREFFAFTGDSIKAAADAMERLVYGSESTGTNSLHQKIVDAIAEIDASIPIAGQDFSSFYPGLNASLQPILRGSDPTAQLEDALAKVQADPDMKNISAVISILEDVLEGIMAFARDPIPDKIKQIVDQVADLLKLIRNNLEAAIVSFLTELGDAFLAQLKDQFCKLYDSGYGSALFGEFAGLHPSCETLLERPSEAIMALNDGFLAASTGHVFDTLVKFATVYENLSGKIVLSLDRLTDAVDENIDNALVALADRFEIFDPSIQPDIRDPRIRREVSKTISEGLIELLRPVAPKQIKSSESACAYFDRLKSEVKENWHKILQRSEQQIEATLRPAAGIDPEQLLQDLLDQVGSFLKHTVDDQLHSHIESAKVRLQELQESSIDTAIQLVFDYSDAFLELESVALLSRLVSDAQGVCTATLESARLLALETFSDLTTLQGHVEKIKETTEKLKTQLSNPKQQHFLNEILHRCEDLESAIEKLDEYRAKIPSNAQGCAQPLMLIDPVQGILRIRSEILNILAGISQRMAAIAANSDPLAVAASSDLQDLLDRTKVLLFSVFGDLADFSSGNRPANWDEFKTKTDGLKDAIEDVAGSANGHVKRLEMLSNNLEQEMEQLANQLNNISSFQDLDNFLSGKAWKPLLTLVDKQSSAAILQAIALTQETASEIQNSAEAALQSIWAGTTPFTARYRNVVETFAAALSHVPDAGDTAEQLFVYVMGLPGTTLLDDLRLLRAALIEHLQKLKEIEQTNPYPSADQIRTFVRQAEITLQHANTIKGKIEQVSVVQVGERLGKAIREQIDALEGEIRKLLKSLIPSSITTEFDWNAELQKDQNKIFDPKNGRLKLKSRFTVDLASQQIDSIITGELDPFSIWIVGNNPDMATIHFKKATFKSVNGSNPDFDLSVEKVDFGKNLKFIEALRNWLTMGEGGFYLRPLEDFSGMEAGYEFSAGLIQVGSLQFINVAFNVYAKLPFFGDPARFGFVLGSRENPFMIASPPYGGGGWLDISADAKGNNQIGMYLFFGAVSAVKFGPLRAQGRVTAGIMVKPQGKGSQIIAIFEAVGRANIACFSLSVCLQIRLTQDGGDLYGTATFRFTFKVGFLKYSYSVGADHRISGGGGAGLLFDASKDYPNEASAANYTAAPENYAVATHILPNKQLQWAAYRKMMYEIS